MNTPSDSVARTYVKLAHEIDRHLPGYLDGYFGPEDWSRTEDMSLGEIEREQMVLAREVSALGSSERRAFLTAQVDAMGASVALLRGEAVPFRQEVKRLYGLEPEVVPTMEIEALQARLEDALPGEGSVAERLEALKERTRVPEERLQEILDVIAVELRSRTNARFELPEDEKLELRFVRDVHWNAYNWYLGDARSRIEVNVDLPLHLHVLPGLMAHEAYPGHHTEHAIKEERLVRERERLEHTALLLNAPEATVSEAVAELAREMVLPDDELETWIQEDLAGMAGVPADAVARLLAASEAQSELYWAVRGNATLLLHEEGASDEEVIDYLQRYAQRTREESEHTLRGLRHPLSRSYGFTYSMGAALLRRALARGEALERFRQALREPVTPDDFRRWADE